jgi:hypothetical protein
VGNSGIAGLNLSMSNDMDSLDMLSPSLRQSQDGVDEQYIGQLSSGYYAHSQPQSRTVVLLQPGQGQGQGLIGGLEPSMKKKNHNNNNNNNNNNSHHNHNGVTYNMNNNNNNNSSNSNGTLNASNQAPRAPRNQTQIQNPNFQQQRTNNQRQRQMTSGSGQGQGQGNFVNMNNIDILNSSSFNSSGVMLSDHRGSLSASHSHSHSANIAASAALGAGHDPSAFVTGPGTGDNLSVNSEMSSGSPQKRGRRDFQLSDNSLINIEADQNRTNMTDRKKNPHPPTAQYDISSSTSISTTVINNVKRYCKDDEKMIEIDAKSY